MAAQEQQKNKSPKHRIFIVEDHPLVRDGLTQLIQQQTDLEVCGGTDSAGKALEAAAQLKPDMVIVDISLKEGNGIELIRDLKAQHDRLPILVFSMHDETFYAERALRAGARGYLSKQASSDEILQAVRQVLHGEIHLSNEMMIRIIEKAVSKPEGLQTSPIEQLSDRELEVFQWIGQGLRPRQIAEEMNLSVKTIESYFARLKQKLNLKSASELTRHAIQWQRSYGID